ncbi:unnamed protein product, partial [Amoebophrya sp. A25]
ANKTSDYRPGHDRQRLAGAFSARALGRMSMPQNFFNIKERRDNDVRSTKPQEREQDGPSTSRLGGCQFDWSPENWPLPPLKTFDKAGK